MVKVRIHLHDEAPRIGSGFRAVEVLSDGYKWVIVRCPYTLARHKFKKAVWQNILDTTKSTTKVISG